MQLSSNTPIFHSMAMTAIQEDPYSYVSQIVKTRINDVRVEAPETAILPAIEATAIIDPVKP